MIFLDTNYLLRFLTNDVKSQAQIARKLISSSKDIYIPVIVFAETVYFLRNYYEASKIDVCDRLLGLINQPNISTDTFLDLALNIYKIENVSFYDCLIVAEAVKNKKVLKTFDQKLHKVWKRYS